MCNLFKYIALQIHLEGILILDHIPYRHSMDITGRIQWKTSACIIWGRFERAEF